MESAANIRIIARFTRPSTNESTYRHHGLIPPKQQFLQCFLTSLEIARNIAIILLTFFINLLHRPEWDNFVVTISSRAHS